MTFWSVVKNYDKFYLSKNTRIIQKHSLHHTEIVAWQNGDIWERETNAKQKMMIRHENAY